ncbi:hypothetical protein QUB28_18685 [Microcoleus sp. B4-C3]|uniref:hypothetical protein n=1 Tax=Microcoleus sp. B4-C2 TaxID=2818661 RepID=UPI002FCF81F3
MSEKSLFNEPRRRKERKGRREEDRKKLIISIPLISEILHHCQEQAFRPVPQKVNFLVEQAGKPVHKNLIDNGTIFQM